MKPVERQATLVTAPNCHLCGHARQVLTRLERYLAAILTGMRQGETLGAPLARY